MAISKDIRQKVYDMYNGHCAYCGCELELKDMQIDHIIPKYLGGEDDIVNYRPSCRMCNFYKGTNSVESFRRNLTDMLMRNVRRPFQYRMALKYGLVKEDVKPIIFYYEQTKI